VERDNVGSLDKCPETAARSPGSRRLDTAPNGSPRVFAMCMFVPRIGRPLRPFGGGDRVYPDRRGLLMTWTKPEFEIVDLCLEVTSYVYRR
jgi:coenzyme PQQ precursor peptide PqqA